MRVFLIHGMARTPVSMWLLKRRLERQGHVCSPFGYSVILSDLDRITERFIERVRQDLEQDRAAGSRDPPSYAVVGHSLGNVITRLASPRLPPGFRGFIMLAPPNRPPVIARALISNPLFRALTRDAGRKLIDESFFDELPMPDVPALVIAGTRGPRAPWLPFGGEPNDAILRVAETRLAGVPSIEVPGMHTFVMNRRDVFEAVRDFLGKAAEAGDGCDRARQGRDKLPPLSSAR